MLDKDDLYCIEQALDCYAAELNNTIARYCSVGAQYEMAVVGKEVSNRKPDEFKTDRHKPKSTTKNPMDILISDMMNARDRMKEIRDKLEAMRLKPKKK